jgi:hypothetical protein
MEHDAQIIILIGYVSSYFPENLTEEGHLPAGGAHTELTEIITLNQHGSLKED